VATWNEVSGLATALADVTEVEARGLRQWKVKGKLFVWERPLRASDRDALGDAAPDGPIMAARVEHEIAKQALLADDPKVFFTTPHFDGYPAVLVQLEKISEEELTEIVVEAWLNRAPPKLAKQYLDEAQ
jgi:hypothetical protein